MPTSSLSPFMITCSHERRSAGSKPATSIPNTSHENKYETHVPSRRISTHRKRVNRTQILEPTHLSMSSEGKSLLGFSFSSTVFGAANIVLFPFLPNPGVRSASFGRPSTREASVLVALRMEVRSTFPGVWMDPLGPVPFCKERRRNPIRVRFPFEPNPVRWDASFERQEPRNDLFLTFSRAFRVLCVSLVRLPRREFPVLQTPLYSGRSLSNPVDPILPSFFFVLLFRRGRSAILRLTCT